MTTAATGGNMQVGGGAINYTQGGGPRTTTQPVTSNNGQVSAGGWTPGQIASAAPINLGQLYQGMYNSQQQQQQAAQQAANQAAAAPGIVRTPINSYFGNNQLGFNAGTSNMGFQQGMQNGQYYTTNPGTSGFATGWGGDVLGNASGQDITAIREYMNSQPAPPSRGQPGYVDPQTGAVTPGAPITYDPNNPMGSIIGAYQQAQDSALDANEQRYQDILAGWQDTYNTALGDINGLGEQQRKDVRNDYMKQGEELKSSLMDRGMSNTTVRDTMLAGNLSEQENSLNRLEDSLIRERMNIALPLRTGMLGFMERREDNYPDFNQLMQLSQMMGMSGSGTGAVNGSGTNMGAVNAAMGGVGNAGAMPGAGGFAGGFGGVNGNMGNVWQGQGGGNQQQAQANQQQGNQGGGQGGGPNVNAGNVAVIGTGKPLNQYQLALQAANQKNGYSPYIPGPNFAVSPGSKVPKPSDFTLPNPYVPYVDPFPEYDWNSQNPQLDWDYPLQYTPYQDMPYQDPYASYYSDPYSSAYGYSGYYA